jgi:hypothetical protein
MRCADTSVCGVVEPGARVLIIYRNQTNNICNIYQKTSRFLSVFPLELLKG